MGAAKYHKKIIWFVLVLGVCAIPAWGNIPLFFTELYAEYAEHYMDRRAEQYQSFCDEFGLAPDDSSNVRAFGQIGFYHELLTGAGAADCVSGGVLKIPYFWHWINPNPRHCIVLLSDSVSLSALQPPVEYARYKSFADIDRTPALFLYDLMSESPRYWHEDCGAFFTFGWCSEREMSFLSLMTCLGYEGKICQAGIHSWSEIRCTLSDRGHNPVHVVAIVDNTFGDLQWRHIPLGVSVQQWLEDIGPGRDVRWYNSVARSKRQRTQLRDMSVHHGAADRIARQVRQWLEPDSDSSSDPRPK